MAATSFFDDFTVLEVEELAQSAEDTVEEFFSILCWKLKKLPGFADQATPLGAVLDPAARAQVQLFSVIGRGDGGMLNFQSVGQHHWRQLR